MVILKCECGAILRVQEKSGTVVNCVRCGRGIRVPHPPSRPAGETQEAPRAETGNSNVQAAVKMLASAEGFYPPAMYGPAAQKVLLKGQGRVMVEVVMAFAALATVFLPWAMLKGRILMSWHVLPELTGGEVTFLVGTWAVAMATVVLSFVLWGIRLWLCYFGLGLGGLILLTMVVPGAVWAMTWPQAIPSGHGASMIFFGLIFLICLLVSTHLRLRLGPSARLRIAQGMAGGGLALLGLARFLLVLVERGSGGGEAGPDLVAFALSYMLLVAGAVTGFLHAIVFRFLGRALSLASLWTLYAGITLFTAYLVLHTGLAEGGLHLRPLYMALLAILLLLVLGSGIVRSASYAYATEQKEQPPQEAVEVVAFVSAVSGIPLEARLTELEDLHARGRLTPDEYLAARRRLLEGLAGGAGA